MTKIYVPHRLWRPAGYAPDRSLLATTIALTTTGLALLDLLLNGLATTALHAVFVLVVFTAARLIAGLSLTPRSPSPDDTPEATP
ncbi:hypothetical protein [Streptomyces mayteni]